MKKMIALLLLISSITISVSAQKTKQHRIVFEITSADTTEQITVLRQMKNVLKDAPGTAIELVCHGPAIFMLVKDKTVAGAEIQELSQHGVGFAACANSMRKNNIDKTQLVPVASIVPNGIMEVVEKEEDGWSYIKG
jgi:uncharacterized protein